jgi:hypothetical protein
VTPLIVVKGRMEGGRFGGHAARAAQADDHGHGSQRGLVRPHTPVASAALTIVGARS